MNYVMGWWIVAFEGVLWHGQVIYSMGGQFAAWVVELQDELVNCGMGAGIVIIHIRRKFPKFRNLVAKPEIRMVKNML